MKRPRELLERLTQLAIRILGDFPLVEEVIVKPDPPIRRIYDSVAIEIQQDRT